jgi:Flp pilus assembly pilin Flp
MKATLRHFAAGPLGVQRGQSMIEYAAVGALLAVTLFVPIPGMQQTVGQLLVSKIRELYSNLTFFLSLP